MIYSGHPRAFDQMAAAMINLMYMWNDLKNALLDKNVSVPKILFLFSITLPQHIITTDVWTKKNIE